MKKKIFIKMTVLSVATITFCFIGLKWNVPIVIWFWPLFLLFYLRNETDILHLSMPVPLLILSSYISIAGGMDMSFSLHIGISLIRSLPFLFALYADRLFYGKVRAIHQLFIYPTVYVICEYLLTLIPLLGASFSLASAFFENKSLIQLTSLTGIWGISFIVSLFSPMVLLLWEQRNNLKTVYGPVTVYTSVMLAILLFGGLRYSIDISKEGTVKIGSVTVKREGKTEKDIEKLLFASSQEAVNLGAKVVFWAEWNLIINESDLERFQNNAAQFAVTNAIYFFPSIAIDLEEQHDENLVYFFNPDGKLVYEYYKTKSWLPTRSDGIIKNIHTPYGTLSSVICFDMDFPAFINQVRKKNIDIMLIPANDWKPIAPFHSQVGAIRGIEHGFSVVRQTYEGLSFASDFTGRVLN